MFKAVLEILSFVRLCRQVLASGKEEAGQVLARPSHCQMCWVTDGCFFLLLLLFIYFFLQLVQWLFVASVAIVLYP